MDSRGCGCVTRGKSNASAPKLHFSEIFSQRVNPDPVDRNVGASLAQQVMHPHQISVIFPQRANPDPADRNVGASLEQKVIHPHQNCTHQGYFHSELIRTLTMRNHKIDIYKGTSSLFRIKIMRTYLCWRHMPDATD